MNIIKYCAIVMLFSPIAMVANQRAPKQQYTKEETIMARLAQLEAQQQEAARQNQMLLRRNQMFERTLRNRDEGSTSSKAAESGEEEAGWGDQVESLFSSGAELIDGFDAFDALERMQNKAADQAYKISNVFFRTLRLLDRKPALSRNGNKDKNENFWNNSSSSEDEEDREELDDNIATLQQAARNKARNGNRRG